MNRLLTLIFVLSLMSCNRISDKMKEIACDHDGDLHLRDDPYCNQIDSTNPRDCDDNDASVKGVVTWYLDGDNDSSGGTVTETACIADMNDGYVEINGDCDDTDASINPDASEIACDEVDNDCNGETDDAEEPTWYADSDGDNFGDPENTINACEQPEGYSTDSSDCDDSDATINTDADETCGDNTDNDCNGIEDDAEGSIVWYADTDNDTYGDPDNATAVCDSSTPDGHVSNSLDCDDTDNTVNPDAAEICDNDVDDNCNGTTDDDAVTTTWWEDSDGDGFGNEAVTTENCAPPEGFVGNSQDCDDTEEDTHPDAAEVCFDGIDNNCNDDGDDCVLEGTIAASDADSRLLGTSDDQFIGDTLNNYDLDNDGKYDLMIGTSSNDTLYLIFGPLSSGDSNIDDIAQVIQGDSGSYVGKSTTGGDFDDDGVSDLAFGSPGTDESFVLLGPLSATSDIWSPSDVDIVYTSDNEGDWGGICITGGGDFDGDGDHELFISAYLTTNADEETNAGAVYIFRGPESSDQELGWANQIFEGSESNVRLGQNMDASADLNGDGKVDLLIGGYQANSYTGVAYLIYGGSTTSGTVSIEDYDDLTLTGEATGDYGGWIVDHTGDFDGTGGTFAISAYKEDTGGTDAGAVYLFLTASGTSLADADVKFTGESADDYAGYALSGGCDINNDGYDDLIIGAFGDDDAGTDAGASYLIYGTSSTLSSTYGLGSADAKFTGENAGDKFGVTVDCMHDNDMYDNVVISASYHDNSTTSSTDSGAVYLFQGSTW